MRIEFLILTYSRIHQMYLSTIIMVIFWWKRTKSFVETYIYNLFASPEGEV